MTSATPEIISLANTLKRESRAFVRHMSDCVLCEVAIDRYTQNGCFCDFPPCPYGVKLISRTMRGVSIARYYRIDADSIWSSRPKRGVNRNG
jgi:hypothetical protein